MTGLVLYFAIAFAPAAQCLPFTEAPKRIGDHVCITGKVVKVSKSAKSGTYFLNFCDDYRTCAFSVVVFPRDVEKVGDVRWLEGKTIEIHGEVKQYKGQAEMVLNDLKQLTGDAAKLPSIPKNYDVENRGKAGTGTIPKGKKD